MFKKMLAKVFKRRKNILIIIAFSVTILFVISGGIYYFLAKKSLAPGESAPAESSPTPSIEVQEKEEIIPTITIKDNTLDILFLGMGGAGHDGGTLSDSITLLRINKDQKILTFIAIPRDLWVAIPAGGVNRVWQKVNMAYSKGGGDLSKYVVSQTLAVAVDHYIAVDFASFTKAINELGGVDVEVPRSWDDYFYPIKGQEQNNCNFPAEEVIELNKKYSGFELEKQFPCRYEQLHFEKGSVHLDGDTALKYIRSRHSGGYGGDFARGEKAQAILLAIGKKLLSEGKLNPTDATFKKLAGVIKSNVGLSTAGTILSTLGDLNSYSVKHIYLTDQNVLTAATSSSGAFILIPKAGSGNFDEVRKFVQN
jgi:LCP family protein required for cell wall assembly